MSLGSNAPEWIRGFLLQEKLPYISITIDIEKNDCSLMPFSLKKLEGIPLRYIVMAASHSNASQLGGRLEAEMWTNFKLVSLLKLNDWLMRSQNDLANKYHAYFRPHLKDLRDGNFHLIRLGAIGPNRERATREAETCEGGTGQEGR